MFIHAEGASYHPQAQETKTHTGEGRRPHLIWGRKDFCSPQEIQRREVLQRETIIPNADRIDKREEKERERH